MQLKLGIIAGSGQFPVLVAKAARAQGYEVYVLSFHGQDALDFSTEAASFTRVSLGQLSKLIDFFQSHKVTEICLAGAISKPRALDVRPDWLAIKTILNLPRKGDDAILRAVLSLLESKGFKVVSGATFLPQLRPAAGVLTRRPPTAAELADIQYGWPIAGTLGGYDIGQCLVVKHNMVMAVECLEGTDATLERAFALAGAGCVAIKRFKPNQDSRVDLPSLGLQTISLLLKYQYSCMAISAHKTLFFDLEESLALADKHKLCIVALADDAR